jgi:hypothetical protein
MSQSLNEEIINMLRLEFQNLVARKFNELDAKINNTLNMRPISLPDEALRERVKALEEQLKNPLKALEVKIDGHELSYESITKSERRPEVNMPKVYFDYEEGKGMLNELKNYRYQKEQTGDWRV